MAPRVVVTGASGGIGGSVCESLQRAGFSILGVDRVPSDWTDGASIDIDDPGFANRLRQQADVHDLVAIVHAAAEQPLGAIGIHEASTWQRVIWTNVLALNSLIKEFRGELSSNGGSVVAIGSLHSHLSRKGNGIYAVSKAALGGWVRSAALEFGPSIRVNSVVPGAVQAGALSHYIDSLGSSGPDMLHRIASRTPMQRIGRPDDVASAVTFLVSDSSSFVTGQNLIVDGGASLLLATEVD